MVYEQFDPERNVLRINYTGKVTPAELHAGTERMRKILVSAKPGFKLLSDLSELASMDASNAEALGCAMDLLKEAGVELVVRVIPDPAKDIGLNILGIFHYGRNVKMMETTTLEEAQQLLQEESPTT